MVSNSCRAAAVIMPAGIPGMSQNRPAPVSAAVHVRTMAPPVINASAQSLARRSWFAVVVVFAVFMVLNIKRLKRAGWVPALVLVYR